MAILLFVDDDGYEADSESDVFDEILTFMTEFLDDETAEQVQDMEDEDTEGKFSYYIWLKCSLTIVYNLI